MPMHLRALSKAEFDAVRRLAHTRSAPTRTVERAQMI
jgi:hypothetical protein